MTPYGPAKGGARDRGGGTVLPAPGAKKIWGSKRLIVFITTFIPSISFPLLAIFPVQIDYYTTYAHIGLPNVRGW